MAGIYIHIPFCKKRCIYCDFFSTTQIEKKSDYVRALCKELEMRNGYLNDALIETIYIGGGTPSQLNLAELQILFEHIYANYKVAPNAEITLEANPDDLSEAYLLDLKKLPINRISMGVQTFDDKKLKLLNRRHTAQQAYEAVHLCKETGFDNISIDLIYGLPTETLDGWKEDLEKALSLPIKHLSAYHLMYEEGTVLWKLWEEHKVNEVAEDLSVQFFELLINRCRAAGFLQYEISNFCQVGYHSRHNSSYWESVPYLGCGASAHSFDGNTRQWNPSSLAKYMQSIDNGKPCFEKEELSTETRYNEYVMTGLRTAKGFSLDYIEEHFGTKLMNYAHQIAIPHLIKGFLEEKERRIKLSHQGIFISDGIMSDFMYVED